MRILALETSCDDLAWAVVDDGVTVIAESSASQVDIHTKTGGVVPEVAAREHVLAAIPTLEGLVAQVPLDTIDAIAVTKGPGLIGSLLVGLSTAITLSVYLDKPLIPVHHIMGHTYALFLDRRPHEIQFPMTLLTVSGGHNDLYAMQGHGLFTHLGATRDDAAGEAFDKVARMLGLSYPGGPSIEKFLEGYDSTGNPYTLPQSFRAKGNLEFSFSGLKSEVRRVVQTLTGSEEEMLKQRQHVAYAFRESVVDILAFKLMEAVKQTNASSVGVTGGVSASVRLKEVVESYMKQEGINVPLYFPAQRRYSTDNAAMIGAAAYWLTTSGEVSPLNTEKEKLSLAPLLSYRLGEASIK